MQDQSQNGANASNISSSQPSSDSPDGSSYCKNQSTDPQSTVTQCADADCCRQNARNEASDQSDLTKTLTIDKANCCNSTQKPQKQTKDSKDGDQDKKKKQNKKKRNIWWIKATVISLVLSAFFSYISNLVENANQLVIVVVLLAFLIVSGIVSDAIGVAVTSCDVTPIISMASRKVYGAKTALMLVKNSDTVSSVCNDIIGDIFSIISGACSAALVVRITVSLEETWQIVLSIAVSAIVSALTIGGKAFMKKIAISNSKDFVMFVARIIAVFSKDERKIRKKDKASKQSQKEAKCADKSKHSDAGGDSTSSKSSEKAEKHTRK